jgi:hypothetical protein
MFQIIKNIIGFLLGCGNCDCGNTFWNNSSNPGTDYGNGSGRVICNDCYYKNKIDKLNRKRAGWLDIKARAWDKKHKRMWQFADIDSEHSCCLNAYDFTGDSYEKYGGKEPEEDLIPLLYSGLKDKNEKEIYKGDFVKQKFPATGTMQKGEIIFNRGRFCINNGTIPDELVSEICEVVGNVYENPELLAG